MGDEQRGTNNMRDAARDALADQRRGALERAINPVNGGSGNGYPNGYPYGVIQRPESSDSGWGLGALLQSLWRNIWIIGGLFALGAVGGTVMGLTRPAEFTSTTTLILSAPSALDTPTAEAATNEGLDPALVESEIEIIRSRSTVERAVSTLGWQQVIEDVGGEPVDDGSAAASELGFQQAVRALNSKMRARQLGASMLIALEARSATPEGAQRLAGVISDSYMQTKEEERLAAAERSTDWLGDRLETLSQEVADKNQSIEQFRARSNLLSIGGATLIERQITELQLSLGEAEAEYASIAARLRQLERISASGGGVDSILTVLNSPVMVGLRAREAEAAQELADLQAVYGDSHPSVIRAQREIQQVQSQIDIEVDRNVANLRNEVEVAQYRVNSLEDRLGDAQAAFRQSNNAQVQLDQLEREAEAATTQYQDYLARAREIGDQASFSVTQVRVVSPPDEPQDPSSPPGWLWSAFGGSIGLTLGALVALTRSATDQRLTSSNDVERRLNVRSLVALAELDKSKLRRLPPSERNPEGFVVNKPLSVYTESVRLLLSEMLHSRETSGSCANIAITSALPGEGKTTTSLALARVAALMRLRVLVIDGDTRRRSLSSRIGELGEADLSDVVADPTRLGEAVVQDLDSGAHVLPVRHVEGGMLPIAIRSTEFRKFLANFRKDYDIILVDCPPMLAVAETRAICGACDATLVIAKWNSTPAGTVRAVVEEIARAGGNLLGVSLNFVNVRSGRGQAGHDTLQYSKRLRNYHTES